MIRSSYLGLLLLLAVGCGSSIDDKGKKFYGGNTGSTNNAATANNSSTNNSTGSNNGGVTPSCGDGTLDPGELCDPGISSGSGSCPTSCQAPACSTAFLTGSPTTCDVQCITEPVACANGDGCCPAGCDASTDDDCSNTCGDGVTEGPETCDGNCPSACDDGNACTTDTLTGSAATCNAECSFVAITSCVSGDGCCPAGCEGSDTDCGPIEQCGNGVVDAGETCDGDCPTSCDDGDACTVNQLTGSAATCTAACTNTRISACIDGDGCCPAGCSFANDSDCACTPRTCAQVGAECGTIDDGCGGTVSCTNTCSTVEICTTQNRCEEENHIGAPCTDYPQCGTNQNAACLLPPAWPNGYCSLLCDANQACPTDSHCTDLDGTNSVCMLDCSSNSSCGPGYECRDFDGNGSKECVPPPGSGDGSVGSECQFDGDCDDPYFCETQASGTNGGSASFPGGACTSSCIPLLAPCAEDGAVCSNTGYCMPECVTDFDCRPGYTCQVGFDGVSGNFCYPA